MLLEQYSCVVVIINVVSFGIEKTEQFLFPGVI